MFFCAVRVKHLCHRFVLLRKILLALWRSNVFVNNNNGIYGYVPEQYSVVFKDLARTEALTIFKLRFTPPDNASRQFNFNITYNIYLKRFT